MLLLGWRHRTACIVVLVLKIIPVGLGLAGLGLAIDSGCVGRTTILVSSRMSSIRQTDWTHVLSGGRIVESGAHAELIHREGKHAKLARLQFAIDDDGRGLTTAMHGPHQESIRCSA